MWVFFYIDEDPWFEVVGSALFLLRSFQEFSGISKKMRVLNAEMKAPGWTRWVPPSPWCRKFWN